MKGLAVRLAGERDAGALSGLYPHWGLERCKRRIKKTLSSERQFRLVAELDGVVAGHICIKLGSMHHSHTATLYSLIVEPKSRGKGIASRLLEEAFKALPERTEILLLQAQHDNDAALQLFKKLGFEQYGYLPKAFKRNREYKDNILMQKTL